ncbi:MAG: hypothetical protein RR698_12950 [Stenotrophomonas sp.]
MRAQAVVALALLMVGPAFGKEPPSAYLERGHDPASAPTTATTATTATVKDAPAESCRVEKEWKVGDTVVQHRICDDPPRTAVTEPVAQPVQR